MKIIKTVNFNKALFIILTIVFTLGLILQAKADTESGAWRSGNWFIVRTVNEMSDEVTYELHGGKRYTNYGTIHIYKSKSGGYKLYVAGCEHSDIESHRGPNIRIDQNEPHILYGSTIYTIDNKIIDEMKKGSIIKVKAHCWISSDKIVEESLNGFAETFNMFVKLSSK